jgi:hypothetical protein
MNVKSQSFLISLWRTFNNWRLKQVITIRDTTTNADERHKKVFERLKRFGYQEDCPSINSWHFRKHMLKGIAYCNYNWNTKRITFMYFKLYNVNN